ncbi:hypothetical protein E2C01_028917 [Portunus trituberculatus]|uniref:Uncharacterized protein n=1 Tax=Portunus trituberculatus TaxID=210409 RepID=A0A5B7ERD2_PORTR|nr:hypothetical protein [Portunus trituberculatus]
MEGDQKKGCDVKGGGERYEVTAYIGKAGEAAAAAATAAAAASVSPPKDKGLLNLPHSSPFPAETIVGMSSSWLGWLSQYHATLAEDVLAGNTPGSVPVGAPVWLSGWAAPHHGYTHASSPRENNVSMKRNTIQ